MLSGADPVDRPLTDVPMSEIGESAAATLEGIEPHSKIDLDTIVGVELTEGDSDVALGVLDSDLRPGVPGILVQAAT